MLRKHLKTNKVHLVAIPITLLVFALLSYVIYTILDRDAVEASPDRLSETQGVLTKQDPDFKTKTPGGSSKSGQWTRVSPNERNPVHAYSDSIKNVPIIVSQQPLPKELKDDTAASTTTLAEGYSATQALNTNNGTAYLGTSAKGPQSVIYTTGNLLILIKSTEKIPKDQWSEYLNSLK